MFMLMLLRVLLIVLLLLVFLSLTINMLFVYWCCYYCRFDASSHDDSLHKIVFYDLGVVSEIFRKTRVLINTS
jgi:hypothetical protein